MGSSYGYTNSFTSPDEVCASTHPAPTPSSQTNKPNQAASTTPATTRPSRSKAIVSKAKAAKPETVLDPPSDSKLN